MQTYYVYNCTIGHYGPVDRSVRQNISTEETLQSSFRGFFSDMNAEENDSSETALEVELKAALEDVAAERNHYQLEWERSQEDLKEARPLHRTGPSVSLQDSQLEAELMTALKALEDVKDDREKLRQEIEKMGEPQIEIRRQLLTVEFELHSSKSKIREVGVYRGLEV